MNRLTSAQPVKIQSFYKNNPFTGRLCSIILLCTGEQKFEESGSIEAKVSHVHHRGVRLANNIAVVSDNVGKNPELSICTF